MYKLTISSNDLAALSDYRIELLKNKKDSMEVSEVEGEVKYIFNTFQNCIELKIFKADVNLESRYNSDCNYIINLEHLEYANSHIMNELIKLRNFCKKNKKTVKIKGINDNLKEIFNLVQFDVLFEIEY